MRMGLLVLAALLALLAVGIMVIIALTQPVTLELNAPTTLPKTNQTFTIQTKISTLEANVTVFLHYGDLIAVKQTNNQGIADFKVAVKGPFDIYATAYYTAFGMELLVESEHYKGTPT